ncbi:MAG: 30S ribosomal protein S12 methylthiotransferase RimO [bacterium]|nr:MAG: 30S ribosomal protein S12 methylthiotransferase RimO [bacterium]
MKQASLFEIPETYYVFNLGCPKNLVDAEVMATRLEEAGWGAVSDPEDASLLVVTTCAFIAQAEEESIEEILRISSAKGRRQRLVVAGCLVSREREELKNLLPEVDLFLAVDEMATLPERLVQTAGRMGRRGVRPYGRRILFTPPHLAYVKIADGCSNHCSYCTIPSIRGELTSLGREGILEETSCMVSSGVKELAIVAQDTGAWDMERGAGSGLYGLLRDIGEVVGEAVWIRLMYMHPAHVDLKQLVALFTADAICRYLDIPIQHVSDSLLERMGRGYGKRDLVRIFDYLRSRVEGLVLRTTVMVGFPGETEENHRELIGFLEDYAFDHVGIFVYSPEAGTEAASLGDRVPVTEAQSRRDEVLDIQMDISHERLQSLVGSAERVLVDGLLPAEERPLPGVWGIGRYYGQAYEIDGVTFLSGTAREVGSFVTAQIDDAQAYDLFASTGRNFD